MKTGQLMLSSTLIVWPITIVKRRAVDFSSPASPSQKQKGTHGLRKTKMMEKQVKATRSLP